jgi:hypothetical protein
VVVVVVVVVDVLPDGAVVPVPEELSEVEPPPVLFPEPSPEPDDVEVLPPGGVLAAGDVKLEGDMTGAVPPDAMAICLGLSCFGLSLTSVPCTAAATCGGTLPPVFTEGGEGAPPPGGVTEKCPGGTGTVRPPDENST